MSLFFKECKKVIFSLTFLIYTAVTLAMYLSQYDSERKPLENPLPGQESYGTAAKEVPEILMPAAAEGLINEYVSGSFTAYPVGFYKSVRLTEKKSKRMEEIIYEISGITGDELAALSGETTGGLIMTVDKNGNLTHITHRSAIPEISIAEGMTYEHFRELMREADKLIGGGSYYSDDYIIGHFSRIQRTYEEALAEYEAAVNEEKISPAYARLFCDYMCIDLGVLPVFAAAALAAADKRSGMCELIGSRRISSARLVITRYLALVTVMLIPVVFAAVHAAIGVEMLYPDQETAPLAFAKYSAVWLVPNILTAAAAGMLLTELLSPLAAVFAQSAWWFASVFSSAGGLTGSIGRFTLVPRHNSLYGGDIFRSTLPQFTFNRIFYTLLSAVLVIITVIICDAKRRGGFNVSFANYKDRKGQSAV